MKGLRFAGDSLRIIKQFPKKAKRHIGSQLLNIQHGGEPDNWKPMKTIGKGVKELRTRVSDGTYRTIYITTLCDTVYVLHAFQKKAQKTPQRDIDLATKRLTQILRI